MTRLWSLVLVLIVLVGACTTPGDTTTTIAAGQSSSTTASEGPPTTSGETTTTSVPFAPLEADLSGLEGVSEEVKAQLTDVIRESQEIRELAFMSIPNIVVVTREDYEARVRAKLLESSDDFPADEGLYKLLGLLAESADYQQLVLELVSEGTGGFYDDETHEVVVPASSESMNVLERSIMVHELVHAITDQHFEFAAAAAAMVDENRLDEFVAYQALSEGDAFFAQLLWVSSLSSEEQFQWIGESLAVDQSAATSAPRFLRESLIFPYDTGLAFVQSIHDEGGWDAVDDAYTAMVGLPGSSEQIITPDDYMRDLPVSVAIPDVDLAGYELERTSVWGEQSFRLMLNQGTTAGQAMLPAVDGWGGDSYHQWFDGENSALLIVFEGDTQQDVDEMEEGLLAYALESAPEDNFVWVEQAAGRLFFIAADATEVGEQIRAAVGLG